jgi:hypothetical protein
MPKIKKQVAAEAENKAKQRLKQKVKVSMEKYAPVIAAKKAYFATVKQLHYNTFWIDLQNSSKEQM